MMSLIEWIHFEKKRKEKELENEPRGNQTNGESGNIHNKGETTRSDSKVAKQAVYVFSVPEL